MFGLRPVRPGGGGWGASEAPDTELGFWSNSLYSGHQKELIWVLALTDVVTVKNVNGFCESVCK